MPESLDLDLWRETIERVDREVNALPYRTDQIEHGRLEHWQRIGLTGAGDCEDYAIEKMLRLRDEGVPGAMMGVITCTVPREGGHAVLGVRVQRDGDAGLWILDNIDPSPCPYEHKALRWGYRFQDVPPYLTA